MIEKPMLSATVTRDLFHKLRWPLMASPKLDGIRVLNHPDLGPVTRSFKPVPNKYARDTLQHLLLDTALDGEILATTSEGEVLDFNATQSAVMTRGG